MPGRSGLSALALSISLLAGCGAGTSGPSEKPTRPQFAVTVRPVSAPLSPAEVVSFLEIVRLLPGEQPPEPTLPPVPELGGETPPRERLAAWRGHIRRQLEPEQIAQSWKHGSRVQQILADHGIEPVAFASLMSRISATWVSASLESTDLAKETSSAENRIELAVRQLEEIDRRSRGLREVPAHWVTRREAVWASLQELVSLVEFLRLMRSVPDASREAIQARRTALAKLLPAVEANSPFELRDDRRIVPTGFDEPQ